MMARRIGRRSFLSQNSLLLLTGAAGLSCLKEMVADESHPSVQAIMVTDMHFADKPAGGSRHYRETLRKLGEAVKTVPREKTDFTVELGDFIDAAETPEIEQGYLTTIQKVFDQMPGEKHYVLGNHCVDTLTKEEFLGSVNKKRSYYSFDVGSRHFVILDSCFRSDGTPYGRKNFSWTDPNIPDHEVQWLEQDLSKTNRRTVVFAHQRLDVSNHYGVKNCGQVREVLEKSGKVDCVFQGHSHQNEVREIQGIHYCTLAAMVEGSGTENNAYSLLQVYDNDMIQVKGFRRQKDYQWS